MHCVDGFVLPVPKRKLAAHRRMAKYAGRIRMEYGALQYVECVADDGKRMFWGGFKAMVEY